MLSHCPLDASSELPAYGDTGMMACVRVAVTQVLNVLRKLTVTREATMSTSYFLMICTNSTELLYKEGSRFMLSTTERVLSSNNFGE